MAMAAPESKQQVRLRLDHYLTWKGTKESVGPIRAVCPSASAEWSEDAIEGTITVGVSRLGAICRELVARGYVVILEAKS
jgi:hypothetical protein